MVEAAASQGEVLERAYARFWPRVRALYIDSIILVRRVVVVLAYGLAVSALVVVLALVVELNGLVSAACIDDDRCMTHDELVLYTIVFGWLALCLAALALGWRGRLYGCRVARSA